MKTRIIRKKRVFETFSLEQLKQINNRVERIRYCESCLPVIGSGTGREVFKLNDEQVLKISLNAFGDKQIKNESSERFKFLPFFTKIYDYDKNYKWAIYQYAKRITREEFQRITGHEFKSFLNIVEDNFDTTKKDELVSVLKEAKKNGLREYSLIGNWGKIIDKKSGKCIGTVATKEKNLIEQPLSNYELGLCSTKAGIPYHDHTLTYTKEKILKLREIEFRNSDLMTSSQYMRSRMDKEVNNG